jgi:hypothetical protein
MSAKTSTPGTFTKEEQLELRNLNSNLELFQLLKGLLQQGQFPGSAAVALIRCQQFADNIITQTSQAIEGINKAANERPDADATASTQSSEEGEASGSSN